MRRPTSGLQLCAALLLAAVPCAAACAADEPVKLEITYYDVAGSNARDIRTDINARRPAGSGAGGYDGRTDWKVGWRYNLTTDGQSCRVDSLETTLNVAMRLPRWSPPPHASDKLVAQWDRYDRALRLHEDGHQAIAVAARDALQRTGGLTALVAPDCKMLAAKLDAAAKAVLDGHQSLDAAYDVSTAHGKTQGARFP